MIPTFLSRRRFSGSLLAAAAAIPAVPVRAEAPYPNRPVRVMIGFAPGGGADAVARIICNAMADDLQQPFVVDNRPGANANIATDLVAKAPNDGYTLLYNTSSLVISPYLYARLPYDLGRDLLPVAQVAAIPLVLVASPRIPAKNVPEFVAYLKSRPGEVNYASSGIGNITHLAAAEILRLTGTTANHVPYRSEAPAINDMLAGQIDFYVGNANTLIPQIGEGRLVALAVTSLQRIPQLPNIPTLDQSVSTGLEMVAWSGFMAPRGTPAAIVEKLAASAQKASGTPALRSRIEETGAQVRWSGPADYGRLIGEELERWGKVVKAAGLQLE